MRTPARPRELFGSLEELLSPATLAAIEGRGLREVRQAQHASPDSLSGSRLLHVETVGVNGEVRAYVVKCLNARRDWLMRACDDERGRAVLAWEVGLLDRVPATIDHTVVACARDGEEQVLLQCDIAADLVPPGDAPIDAADHDAFIAAMTTLHAGFWGEGEVASPQRGFISLAQHYHCLSPDAARRCGGPDDVIPQMVLRGWELLPELAEPDVAEVIGRLLDDPLPLCDALEPYAVTVVHGDWKLGNMGLRRSPEPITRLLDWDRVSAGPPALDLAWYLAVNSARLPVSKDATIAMYEQELGRRLGDRFDRDWWAPQLALGLVGGFVQLGWPKLLGAASDDAAVRERERAELAWWSARVREGAVLL